MRPRWGRDTRAILTIVSSDAPLLRAPVQGIGGHDRLPHAAEAQPLPPRCLPHPEGTSGASPQHGPSRTRRIASLILSFEVRVKRRLSYIVRVYGGGGVWLVRCGCCGCDVRSLVARTTACDGDGWSVRLVRMLAHC